MNEHASNSRGRSVATRFALHAAMAAIGLAYAVPLIFMVGVAARPASQASSPSISPLAEVADAQGTPIAWWDPARWWSVGESAASNLREVWISPLADFPTYLRNTLTVGLLSVVGMTLSSAIAAYGFARLRFPGRDALFAILLLTLMVPQAVLMSPQFLLFKHLHLIGSLAPLWLPSWFAGAFSVFLLRQFFMGIPRELDEAARIDGCGHMGIFVRIILPLSRPALAVVALMQAVAVWNDFLGPLLFLNRDEQYTLSLGLQMYQSQHGGTPWHLVMAASCIVVLPVLVLYLLARRLFVEGVATQGAREA
ncbi:MAG: carbohydrate ABC transporter permease [Phycisphaerae bacterium]|jgi:multiple sugar transport system permease protein